MSFHRTLNFTSSNEDGATELEALRLRPADRVLALTASGGRVLDLLLGDPAEVTALDLNASQNQLLALKIAAIRTLEADELYRYLGVVPCARREALHARVETALTPESLAFWRERRHLVRAGVWLSGRWERVLRLGALGTRALRGRAVDALFGAPDLQTQAAIWRDRFDDGLWRAAIRLLSRRWFWTRVVGEPGGAFLPDPAACERRLAGVFTRASRSVLFRECDFAWLVFRGRHNACALPLHLRRENLPVVGERLDRVRIVQGGLHQLQAQGDRYDAFSLSDFGSYCRPADYEACWRGVLAAAAPGARFCERVFMNPVAPPAPIAEVLAPDASLEARLSETDRALIYDIRCGVVTGARDVRRPLGSGRVMETIAGNHFRF